MSNIRILTAGGSGMTVMQFLQWEYNGGKSNFSPDKQYLIWDAVPIEDKLGYIACNLYSDLTSSGEHQNFLGVTDGYSNYYFRIENKENSQRAVVSLNAMLNVLYTSAESDFHDHTGLFFTSLNFSQRLEAVSVYITNNIKAVLMMLTNVPGITW